MLPLAMGVKLVERTYWLRRQQEALAMAQSSSSAEGRIVHAELARRYGVEAGAMPVPCAPEGATARLQGSSE